MIAWRGPPSYLPHTSLGPPFRGRPLGGSINTVSISEILFSVWLQADALTSLHRLGEEKEFLRGLNDTLLANQRDFKQQLEAAKQQLGVRDDTNRDLQEQVGRAC